MKSASFRRGSGFGDDQRDGALGPRPGQRRKHQRTMRQARARSRVLESLEPRTLLAVLPPPSIGTNSATSLPFRIDVSNPSNAPFGFNESNPSLATSPSNPNKMV